MRLFKIAASSAFVSALFHLLAPLFGGLTSEALFLLPFSVMWALIGWGLIRGSRLVAYFAFLIGAIGVSVGLAGFMDPVGVPIWIYAAVTLADLGVAITLFVALWRKVPTA
jgi:hypothetical protein